MAFTRYATSEYADVLDLKGSSDRIYTASLDKIADYQDFRTDDNFLYVRIRAISSRVNQNFDGWPTVELAGSPEILSKHQSSDGFTVEASSGNPKYGFATFMHKPIFVDHNNGDPKKTRGMIVDAKFNVLSKEEVKLDPYWSSRDVDPQHLPGCEIELLLEIDAKNYPKFANAVKKGHIDGFSMGCNCDFSVCSHCGNKASSAGEFCSHVKLKGVEHDYKTSSGERVKKKSYENVGGVQFFEISGVFNPADDTALTKEVIASMKESSGMDGGKYDNNHYSPASQGQYDPNGQGILPGDQRLPLEEAIQGTDGTYQEFEDPGYGLHDQSAPHLTSPGANAEPGAQVPYFMKQNEEVDENGLPIGTPAPNRPNGIYDQAAPTQNDPRWSNVHTAENELPQSMKVHAPEPLDTLRDEHMCPICSGQMEGETCDLCFAPGTLIRTAKGLQPIEAIEIGDLVLSADGVLRPVSEVLVRDYKGNLKKINTPSLLEPILTTPNHPFAALVGDHGLQKTDSCRQSRCTRHTDWEDRHHLGWLHAGCLTTDHYVVSNHLNNSIVDIDTINVPEEYRGRTRLGEDVTDKKYRSKAIQLKDTLGEYVRNGSTEFETTPDFLWAVGQYLAEGSNGDRTIMYASHREEIEYQNRLINYFESQGYSTKLVLSENTPNSACVNVNSSTLAEWFPAWLGKGCANKRIPEELMNLPIEKLSHVYDGYLSGDGADEWNSAKTTSPYLALQISEIGRRLGARPSIQTECPVGKRTAYTINNVSDRTSKRRSTNKNIKNTWMFDDHLLYRITSVEDVEYSGPVYNLRIEGNPTYTVQNILVHNCGYTEPPKEFDNPDLNKAKQIREEMKAMEEAQAGPQQPQATPGQGAPNQPMPNNSQTTASVNSRMTWTPLVTEKTAAKINKVEVPVLQPNTIVTNQPSNQTVISDQKSPVTSAMLTAQRLMATAQRNHIGESMSNTRVADGATPPDGTSAKNRVDVVGVGGFDEASNEAASAAQKQIDVNGVGGTGVEGVEPDSTESLPTADPKGNDAGFNTDKTTEDSGPTSTFGDTDGSHSGITDPVTSDPFPASEDGVKAANAYYAAVKRAQDEYATARVSYDDSTLEKNEQQGGDAASTNKHVKGTEPSDPIGKAQDRINPADPATSTKNNSGKTDTWHGTDGNGVTKQQEPVTKEKQETGGVPTPDVTLHTGSVRISSIRLAELEIDLGLTPVDEKYNRIAALDSSPESVVQAKIETLSQVKTAGVAKLAHARTAGVTKVPSLFGKATAAPNGFARIASDHQTIESPIDDPGLDSAIFVR